MSANKPLLRVLGGEVVWPPPIWLMRQAGRYLPEYRAVRARASDFIDLCTTPALATEVTLQPIRRFGFDAAILFSDILMLPWALGQPLVFREGEGPVLPPLLTFGGVASLNPERLPGAIAPVLETVRLVRAGLADAYPATTLIGFAGAPFTVACYMVDGRGGGDFPLTRRLAYHDPAVFGALLDLLTEATIISLLAQIRAGAEAVMLFDSWAGLLPPSLFRRYVIAPARRIVAALRAACPEIPMIGFPRLGGSMLGEYAAGAAVAGLGVDTSTDLAVARLTVGPGVALQGNLDPLVLLEGGTPLREATMEVLDSGMGAPFIFNLGHGILPDTRPEHVASLIAQVRAA